VSSVGKFCLIVTKVHRDEKLSSEFSLTSFMKIGFVPQQQLCAYRTTESENGFEGHRQGHKRAKSTRIRVKPKGA
jgi:hypothetical protein